MRVGAIVIGQTPRPDLEAVLGVAAEVRGALDLPGALDFPEHDPESPGIFPLRTRLKDGRVVVVDEPWLAPRVQEQIQSLEADGADVVVLLCAGPFAGLASRKPLVHPFRLGVGTLRAMGVQRLLTLVPIPEQVEPARHKWSEVGFQPDVVVFPDSGLADFVQGRVTHADAVVLDYVGLDQAVIDSVRRRVSVPVVDLGHLASAALKSMSR